jgi:hypothetical protein
MEENDEGARADLGETGAEANAESIMFALFGEEGTTADEVVEEAEEVGGSQSEGSGTSSKRRQHRERGPGRKARRLLARTCAGEDEEMAAKQAGTEGTA